MTFTEYLSHAVAGAVADAAAESDRGQLRAIRELCRRGVRSNWEALDGDAFLWEYFYVVGMSGKRWDVRERYLLEQQRMLNDLEVERVVREAAEIRRRFRIAPTYMNNDMVDAVISVASTISGCSWETFKSSWLLLPSNPESPNPDDWNAARRRLRRLGEVGNANSWYLVRNLYGGPFFKPDVHIDNITEHFFGQHAEANRELSAAVREAWSEVGAPDWLTPVHLGEVDYILWWHRRKKLETDPTLNTHAGRC